MRKLSLFLASSIVCSLAVALDGPRGTDPALQEMGQQLQEGGHARRALDQQYNIRKRTHPKPEQTTTQATQVDTPVQPGQTVAPVESCFTNPKMPGCMTKEEVNSLTSPSTPGSEQ